MCTACGCCTDVVRIQAPTYRQLHTELGPVGCFESSWSGAYSTSLAEELASCRRKQLSSNSAPYRRSTYFAERVSQWRGLEPDIGEDEWLNIRQQWGLMSGQFDLPFRRWPEDPPPIWPRDHILTRDDCRLMLRLIDDRLRRVGLRGTYVKRFFEKFLSIRRRLCGVHSTGENVSDVTVSRMKQLFDKVQNPFGRAVRDQTTRYSFISYNFTFRRIFDLLGIAHLHSVDFPPLKSRKKREDVIFLWLRVIKALQWPYINSDREVFGEEYGADIRDIAARRPPHGRRAERASSHAQQSIH